MVDVEHHAVSSLKKDAPPGGYGFVQIGGGVANIAFETRANLVELGENLTAIDRLRLQDGLQVKILVADVALEFLIEGVGIHQVVEAQTRTSHLVFVGWADAESGGANRTIPRASLARSIDRAMIRHHYVSVVAELQQRVVAQPSALFQPVDLFHQGDRIDHGTVADHAGLTGVQGACGHEPQDKFFAVNNQRMRRIVATLKSNDDVCIRGEEVYDFTFAFVAPLRANNCDCFHSGSLADSKRSSGRTPFRAHGAEG